MYRYEESGGSDVPEEDESEVDSEEEEEDVEAAAEGMRIFGAYEMFFNLRIILTDPYPAPPPAKKQKTTTSKKEEPVEIDDEEEPEVADDDEDAAAAAGEDDDEDDGEGDDDEEADGVEGTAKTSGPAASAKKVKGVTVPKEDDLEEVKDLED